MDVKIQIIFALILINANSWSDAVAQETDCNNPGNQSEINECAWREYRASDRELNAVYKIVIDISKEVDEDPPWGVNISITETLREAQRKWIPFRDKFCLASSVFSSGRGSMQIAEQAACLEELTRKRTAELKYFFNQ